MKEHKKIIIIGSGIGGLICGAILAKEGYKITILEKNKQIGGCLQIFVRNKHIFNSSVHYIGGIDKGQTLHKIFSYLGIMAKLEVERLDEFAAEKIIFHNDPAEYNIAQGYTNFTRSLIADFPEEENAIIKYADMMQAIGDKYALFNTVENNFMEDSQYLKMDAQTYIASLTKNKLLQSVLAGNNLIYAGISNKTPLFIHALVVNSYIESAWIFKKGSAQIAKLLSKVITENGGVVKKNKTVSRIVEEEGLVKFIESEDGDVFHADHFISNIHPAKTLQITESDTIRNVYRNRIKSLENSTSIFTLNIVFKPHAYRYINSNYCCFVNNNVWDRMNHNEENWPLTYTLFFTKSNKNPLFAETATVMAYMNFNEVKKWENSYNVVNSPEDRGESYEDFKKQKAEKLLDVMSIKFPEIRNAIHAYYTSTPLSYRDYMGTDDGAIYGIVKDYKAPLQNMISGRTKIRNLFLVGQNINVHGVHGVIMSSIMTCGAFIDLPSLLKKMENA